MGVFSGFFFFCIFQVCFSLVHSSGITISFVHVCARALFFGCVCVSVFFFFFLRTLDLPLVGSASPRGRTPHVAGLGQGAGPRLLRGSLCLKPLKISYCSSQGTGWGLAEGFLATASLESRPQGLPCQAGRVGGVCE